MLFNEDIEYTSEPPRYSESAYALLRRADGRHWDRIRATINEWYAQYPDPEGDLRNRFCHNDARQHLAAWWELYIYTLFRSLGWDIEVHPSIPGSTRRPDFVATAAESPVYIECVTAFDGPQPAQDDALAWMRDCINEVDSPDFGFSLTIHQAGSRRAPKSSVTEQIESWASTIDYEAVRTSSHSARELSKTFEFADSQVTLTPIPRPKSQHGIHSPNILIDGATAAFAASSVDRMRNVIRKKVSQGKGVQGPFIVAVLSSMKYGLFEHVDQALFGSESDEYAVSADGTSAGFARRVRQTNGVWHPGPPARGSGLSGVLFTNQLRPTHIAKYLPTLWVNPWAANALVGTLPFRRRSASSAGVISDEAEATSDARTILGLPAQWPGPI